VSAGLREANFALAGKAQDAHVVCVALDGERAAGAASIVQWVERGKRVLAYAHACDAWSIGRRCHVVLAGAAVLVDSAELGFAQRIAGQVRAWQREATSRQSDIDRGAQRMAAQGLVGTSSALRAVFAQVERVARLSDMPVLLRGETGSGKEMLANAIHRLDERRGCSPFVAINCAAIAPSLAEAELFGHKRGAYTGAISDKRGLVRSASGGTLFLDEVGELAEDLQGKLLRVIQERRVLPVGAEHEEPVDVRIVAATHRDLAARVREGRFREDLYFRLAVLPIEVPPLRERREDIDPLIDHLLLQHARRYGTTPHRASKAFRHALAECELPGNVRELDNLVSQAIVAAGGAGTLELAHLPLAVLRHLERAGTPQAVTSVPGEADEANEADEFGTQAANGSLAQLFAAQDWKLTGCLNACECALLKAALLRSRGNQTAAARLLGVTPRCVYAKLHKHMLG
jgi:transcriptional regulator with GAF, ATPase, and Fis domain